MKYKVGDKFLQEIEVARVNENDPLNCPYMMEPEEKRWSEEELEKLRRPDDMTAEEAWVIARKIGTPACYGGFACKELGEIFGTTSICNIFEENTLHQAKAKIEAWEAEKEIKVGDIVHSIDRPEIEVMITVKHESGYYDGINAGGSTYSGMNEKYWKKTGRHIDIQSVLEQIEGKKNVE